MLESRGYPFVVRTAGSHSPIDVFAIDPKLRLITLAQCKRSRDGRFETVTTHIPSGMYLVRFETHLWQDRKGFVETSTQHKHENDE